VGRFFGTRDGIKRDELMGGTDGIPVSIRNVEVAKDAAIERGMLLASASTFGVFAPAAASDTGKVLVIAEKDFAADSDHTVTQAYTSGKFNREKIKLGTGLNIDNFEEPLRKVNIILTSIAKGTINKDEWQIGN